MYMILIKHKERPSWSTVTLQTEFSNTSTTIFALGLTGPGRGGRSMQRLITHALFTNSYSLFERLNKEASPSELYNYISKNEYYKVIH